MPNIDNIIKELKTRKVFRSLAIYAAFAFVLIQVCSIVVPALLLPDWTMRLLVVLVIIGFPATLVLSWIYDITPSSKNEETASTKVKEDTKPLGIYALTGLVLTVVGVAFWIAVGVFGISFGGNDEVPSIGILMMENLGGEDEEYWSSGMTADLITKVAGAGLIRVSPLDDIVNLEKKLSVDEKAKKLRVKYILTNRFQKKEDVFALWYQLINTEDGSTVLTNKINEPLDKTTQMVGMLANEIITSLGVSTKQDMMKAPTNNADAYEYYLKGKYKFEKRETLVDTEIARELLQKAIEIDDELISAKIKLGETYEKYNDIDKAMEIYKETLNQSEKLGDKKNTAISLRKIGVVYYYNLDYEKTLDYFIRSLELSELINDKALISMALNNIGAVYKRQNKNEKSLEYFTRAMKIAEEIGDLHKIAYISSFIAGYYISKGNIDTALDFYTRSLEINEELGEKEGMGDVLYRIGEVFIEKGDYDIALDYYARSLKIFEEIGDKFGEGSTVLNIGLLYHTKGDYEKELSYYERALELYEEIGAKNEFGGVFLSYGFAYYEKGEYNMALDYYTRALEIYEEFDIKEETPNLFANIGIVYFQQENYKKAVEYLEKSATMQMDYNSTIFLETISHLFLSKKILGKEYNVAEIHTLIKEQEKIEDYINYALFKLLENISYLETAYNQVQETADAMEDKFAKKFLSYPIPKAIVEEWEKVK